MPDQAEDDVQANWLRWQEACQREDIAEAFAGLYANLSAAIERFGPTCWASGKCCKFETYGHRLYVTGLEIVHFLNQRPTLEVPIQSANDESISLTQFSAEPLADACRYQRDGKCTVHAIRPLGCRVFFCQEGTEQWQQYTYESFQKQVVALHEAQGLPYHYMEWRRGLIEAERYLPGSLTPGPESA